jgi:hypothetical protein
MTENLHHMPTPIPATRFDASRRESWHIEPQFLPDGRHFICLAVVTAQVFSGVYVGSLDSGETKRLLDTGSNAIYANPGYLLLMREVFLWRSHSMQLDWKSRVSRFKSPGR